jgi:two-component system cell cycle sensor histidine kinase/response regulator CckA
VSDDDGKSREELLEELEAARQEIALHRSVSDGSSDCIMRYDSQGRHTYANRSTLEATGLSASQYFGRTHREMGFPEHLCAMWESKIQYVFETSQPTAVEFEVELAVGSLYMELKLHPECDETGRVTSVLGVSRDITERWRAEEALRDSEEMFRSLFHQSGGYRMILEPTPSGIPNILDANEAALEAHGFPREEMIGRPVADLDDEEGKALCRERTQLLMSGEPLIIETNHVRKDGTVFPVAVYANLVRFAEKPPLILTTEFDITQRRQAEADRLRLERQLSQSQRLESLGVLAGGLAHDFNNLLVGILGNVDLALLDIERDSQARGYLESAMLASQRAGDLIAQMLAYAGKGKTLREPVALNGLVQEIADLLKASVSKKTTLRFDLGADLPPILGDATQIRQIAMNLITNADQALQGRSGEIVVKTEEVECDRVLLERIRPGSELPGGLYVSLCVTDTGVGMSQATQDRVFDPFFTTKTTGRGLGLSAVHGIVRGHGAAIQLESELGKGTSFTVLFLAAQRPTEAGEAPEVPDLWRGSGTILVVDDEELVRSFAESALEHFGFSVLSASDGVEAVEIFSARHDEINAVLLDLKMPRMDGEETFEELRKIREEVPVILSSGFTEEGSVGRFADKGLAGFIQKPYSLAALKGKLREVLGG